MNRKIFVLICVLAIFAVVNTNRLRRSTNTCGVPKRKTGFIVRGQSFSRGDFPWIVALMYTNIQPPSFFCGGSLISSTFVLSAAHCINEKDSHETLLPRDILAFFGAHDLKNLYETGRFALSPKEIFIHDKWNPRTTEYDSDLSLLEFEDGNIIFNNFVQPICLWYSENESPVTEGEVVGWGKSEDPLKRHEDVPKLVKVQIKTNEQCFFNEKALVDLSSFQTFCAGLRNGSGVCHGDSGGGLFIKINNIHHLKGIVSSSLLNGNDCDVLKDAVYSNVQKFRSWIEKVTGSARISPVQAVMNVLCTFETDYSQDERGIKACVVKKAIGSEGYVVGSERDSTVKRFDSSENKQVKFLPSHIGEKFPNLESFRAINCALTVVRDFYFKSMTKIGYLSLTGNKIATIEPKAFQDLISVKKLYLNRNMLETLDEKLFVPMINLRYLYLNDNKIKTLTSATFEIPNGSLYNIDLRTNVCIDDHYWISSFKQLENAIKAKCTG